MIKQLIKIIYNERRANMTIFVELLVVSLCMWFLVDTIYSYIVYYNKPKDVDINNVYRVEWSIIGETSDEYDASAEIKAMSIGKQLFALNDMLRHYEGVEASAVSYVAVPYTGSDISKKFETDSTNVTGSEMRAVSEEFPMVYNMRSPNSTSEQLSQVMKEGKMILSSKFANKLFGTDDCIGKSYYEIGDNRRELIVGDVLEESRSEEMSPDRQVTYFILEPQDLTWQTNLNIDLRVKEDAVDGFVERFRVDKENMRYGNLFVSEIRAVKDVRDSMYKNNYADLKMLGGMIVFLLVNVFLGVVGTFWYRSEQRKKEMGLRMAIGSTRSSLRTILVGEGILMLVMAYVLILIVAANCFYFVLSFLNTSIDFSIGRFFTCHAIVFATMVVMIMIGVFIPSQMITKLKPAEVLHAE